MDKVRKKKQLETRLGQLQADEQVKLKQLKQVQKEHNVLLENIRKTKEEIAKINNDPLTKVSEHAVLRYIERVKGVNTDNIAEDILHPKVKEMIQTLGGSGSYPHPDGFNVVMKNNTVVTIT